MMHVDRTPGVQLVTDRPLPPPADRIRVLATRQDSMLSVELAWNQDTDTVMLYLEDEDGLRCTPVPRDEALQAFYHPYGYLPDEAHRRLPPD